MNKQFGDEGKTKMCGEYVKFKDVFQLKKNERAYGGVREALCIIICNTGLTIGRCVVNL